MLTSCEHATVSHPACICMNSENTKADRMDGLKYTMDSRNARALLAVEDRASRTAEGAELVAKLRRLQRSKINDHACASDPTIRTTTDQDPGVHMKVTRWFGPIVRTMLH